MRASPFIKASGSPRQPENALLLSTLYNERWERETHSEEVRGDAREGTHDLFSGPISVDAMRGFDSRRMRRMLPLRRSGPGAERERGMVRHNDKSQSRCRRGKVFKNGCVVKVDNLFLTTENSVLKFLNSK